MELWRTEYGERRRPPVVSGPRLAFSIVVHLLLFAAFWLFAACHGLFDKKEEIIPIDLTVVVNENLNGKENEPPPLKKPEPEKPKAKPPPKPKVKEPEKPKALEQIVTNVVAKVDKKVEEKKPDKKKPKKQEKPKKSARELREERLAQMRKAAKVVNTKVEIEVKNAKASGNGRTARRTLSEAEIRKKLDDGYQPGTSEQLAASDAQLAYSLIRMAFEAKWDKPPWTDTLKPMTVRVWFGPGGKILKFSLESSSGDGRADQSILSAASRVGSVPGLPPAFIDGNRVRGVPVRFTVTPN